MDGTYWARLKAWPELEPELIQVYGGVFMSFGRCEPRRVEDYDLFCGPVDPPRIPNGSEVASLKITQAIANRRRQRGSVGLVPAKYIPARCWCGNAIDADESVCEQHVDGQAALPIVHPDHENALPMTWLVAVIGVVLALAGLAAMWIGGGR